MTSTRKLGNREIRIIQERLKDELGKTRYKNSALDYVYDAENQIIDFGASSTNYDIENESDIKTLLSKHNKEVRKIIADVLSDSSVYTMTDEEIMLMGSGNEIIFEDDAEKTSESTDMQSDEGMQMIANVKDELLEGLTEYNYDTFEDEESYADYENDKLIYTDTHEFLRSIEEGYPTNNLRLYSQEEKYEENKLISLTNEQIDAYDNSDDLLHDMYNDESVVAIIDEDGNGKISSEEREKFEFYLLRDQDRIYLDNLKDTAKQIKNDEFDIDDYKNFKVEDIEPYDTQEPSEFSARETIGSNGATGAPLSGSISTPRDPSDINQMTLEELESKQSELKNDIASQKDNFEAIREGNSEVIEAAQKNYDDAQKAYQEALKGEKNEQVLVLEAQRQEQQTNIDDTNKAIIDINVDILNITVQITDLDIQINSLNAEISGLNNALASYSKSDDDEAKEKLASIQEQIAAKQSALSNSEEQKTALEEQKTQKEADLNEQKTLLNQYEQNYNDISNQIKEMASENTKMALEAMDRAKSELQTKKDGEIQSINETINAKKEQLSEVNAIIQERKAAKIESENSAASPQKAVELLEEMAKLKLSQPDLRKLYNSAGVDFHEGLYCGETAYYALLTALGEENLPEWMKTSDKGHTGCHYQSAGGFYSAAKKANAVVDINQAQPGDVLIFDDDCFSNPWGADHVMVVKEVLSNGHIVVMEGNGPGATIGQREIKYDNHYRILSTHV